MSDTLLIECPECGWSKTHTHCVTTVRAERDAAVQRLAAVERQCTSFDNLLSTLRDHLPLCVHDGDFADHSQEMVDREQLAIRALTPTRQTAGGEG